MPVIDEWIEQIRSTDPLERISARINLLKALPDEPDKGVYEGLSLKLWNDVKANPR